MNLTPKKSSRNSVSSFPSPEFDHPEINSQEIITPQNGINSQQPSPFITPSSSIHWERQGMSSNNTIDENNMNREGTLYNQLVKMNSVSNNIHHYSFKPSIAIVTSSYLKPLMSYLFAHRKNIHENQSTNKKGDSNWPEKIVFTFGSIIFFTLFSLLSIYVLEFMFRQKSLPRMATAKDVIYFVIGEVCITILLVFIRLFFHLENSDYDPSMIKHLHKISQHGAEVGVLFEYFTLEEREILFYLSNVTTYVIGYATNSLSYALLFEMMVIHVGSGYGFFKKDILGLCVILANIFAVFLGWFNVRANDSLEVFLISGSSTLMILMYGSKSSTRRKQLSHRNESFPEEFVFLIPKFFRVLHIMAKHLKFDSAMAKHSYVEILLVMAIGILGAIIGFRLYDAFSSTSKRPRQVFLGRPMRGTSRMMYPQPPQFVGTPQQQQPGAYAMPPQFMGTPQQQAYNLNGQPFYYPSQQQQPAYPYPAQQATYTPMSMDKMHYPTNIRPYSTTPQNIPLRY